MKLSSALLAMLFVSSAVLAPLLMISPAAKALDLTPVPVRVYTGESYTETVSVAMSDSGRTFVVWSERVGEDDSESSEVFLSYSSNNATGFSPRRQVNANATGSQLASQAATAGDMLYVVWEDDTSDGGDIIMARSSDGGNTFQEAAVPTVSTGTQSNPAIAASGTDVAVAWEEYRSDDTIRIWNGVNGDKVREMSGHTGAVRAVEFSPNGTYLASGSEDSTAIIWNASTGAQKVTLSSQKEVMDLNWSSNGTVLATGSRDYNVTLYNTTDFSIITRLNSTGGVLVRNGVNTICISPDGTKLAAGYHGQYGTSSQPTGYPTQSFNITVWNLTDMSSWTRNEGIVDLPNRSHTSSVLDVAFSHNGTYLASGGRADAYGNTLKIWDSETGALLKDVGLSWPVHSVAWSPDDRFIAAGLGNGSIAIVNVSSPIDIQWAPDSHTGRVNSLDWSVARDEIVSGASDPVVKVRDHITSAMREGLGGHTNSVFTVDWSPGDLIATAGGNSHLYGLGENQIFCAVSADSGATFGPPTMVSDSTANYRLRPKAAIDASGNISVVWYDARLGGTNIYFANSSDGGASYAANLGVTTDSNSNSIPAVFAAPSGTVHLVWQYGDGAGIRYANSTDGFAASRVMAQTAQMPRVTGSPEGNSVLVSWRHRNSTEFKNYLYVAASYDGGAVFLAPQTLNSSANAIGEHNVFTDRYNQTCVVWEAGEGFHENLFLRTTVLEDEWGPSVVSTSPAEGEVDVSVFTSFTVQFSEPMDRISVEAAFSWTDGTRTWYVGNCTDNVGYWYDDLGGYGDKVTFTPKKADRLRYLKSSYSFKMGSAAADLAGNQLGTDLVVHFTTSADTDPPIIEHYPGQAEVSYDEAYGVVAVITDQWGNVSSATLHYQGVADSSPTRSIDMEPTTQGMYRADIPPQLELGTMYYYISAEDAFGNEAWNPVNYTNHSALYSVAVVDGVKPLILHDPVLDKDVYKPIGIWAVVSDAVQLQEVQLNYKPVGGTNINVMMLPDPNGTANTFIYEIPGQPAIGQVQYNITALDGSGNFNSTAQFTVQIVDTIIPLINSVTPVHLENETQVLVMANVTDNVGIDTVVLYFKAVGGEQWVSREMEHVSGDTYRYTIPAQRRSGTIYYYVNATDESGNVASTLTEQDQFQIEVVGVGQDYTLYYVLGMVLAVLVIVMVLLLFKKLSGGKPASGGRDIPDEVEAEPAPDREPGAPERVDDGG